jgi:uncharacterized protein YbjT (DUF2867 family)
LNLFILWPYAGYYVHGRGWLPLTEQQEEALKAIGWKSKNVLAFWVGAKVWLFGIERYSFFF